MTEHQYPWPEREDLNSGEAGDRATRKAIEELNAELGRRTARPRRLTRGRDGRIALWFQGMSHRLGELQPTSPDEEQVVVGASRYLEAHIAVDEAEWEVREHFAQLALRALGEKSVGALLLRQTSLSDYDAKRLLSAWPDDDHTATD